MFKKFIKTHKINTAILIFLIVFGFIHYYKPSIIYESDNSFREFGLGYKNKTILPIWIFAIVISIMSYLGVSYYIRHG